MDFRTHVLGIWAVLLLAVADRPALATDHTLAVLGGTVIDGTGRTPISDGAVVIKGQRIVAVGHITDIEVPLGATTIRVDGSTVLPGFIDSHIHNGFAPALRREFLTSGVTSICDVGSPMERMAEFDIGETTDGLVARGFRSGPILTAVGGLPDAVLREDLNLEVGTRDEVREAVATLAAAGADFLKIYLHATVDGEDYPILTLGLVTAIVEEAHARGLIVRAHVTDVSWLKVAIEGGVDVVDHVPKPPISWFTYLKNLALTFSPEEALSRMMFVEEYDELFPRMVELGIVMVPTLSAGFGRFIDDETDSARQALAESVVEIIRRFHASGGRIALGTDMNPGTRGEAAIPLDELRLMLRAGFTPLEVISAATKHAAHACGHAREVGTLEVGKLADVIVVSGDPLSNIEALRDLYLVIKGGERVR